VSIRFSSNPAPGLLALPMLALALWASAAHGQAAAPKAPVAPGTPATAQQDTTPAAFRSALEGYQPYADDRMVPWKEANDSVGRIGGWREYARHARQPHAPDAAARPDDRPAQARP